MSDHAIPFGRKVRGYGLALVLGVSPWFPALAQPLNPLLIPPTVDEDTIDLLIDQHVVQFYPGLHTGTYGVNAPYLGPTLILHHGDTAHWRVVNLLDTEMTSLHWHGLQLPGEMDGGPPREVMPGDTWNVKFKVKNPAGTFWYHPHPHGHTAEQVQFGIAGMIILRDSAEAALDLPRTYGVDDIPLVLQDRRFDENGQFVFGPYGDSVLVNGTPHPYMELPAQVVRLRLLNGSNARVYQVGFDDDRSFSIIGNDGGLLEEPIPVDRVRLSNGERSEVLVDLSGMEGDSLMLMGFGSELTETMPGGSLILNEPSYLNAIDFPLLRIRVGPPTDDPVTSFPSSLVTLTPPDIADVTRTRHKAIDGFGTAGTGLFTFDGDTFNMDVVNDTVPLGTTEIWYVLNATDIAHPFHIHGGSFFLLDRDGQQPHPWEQGWKDVVLVDMGEQVRFIMRFDERTDGWPFMYHCHNLMHEDLMLMLQYITEDPSTNVAAVPTTSEVRVFPSPTVDRLQFRSGSPVDRVVVQDVLGREVMAANMRGASQGSLDVATLPSGMYHVLLRSHGVVLRGSFVKE